MQFTDIKLEDGGVMSDLQFAKSFHEKPQRKNFDVFARFHLCAKKMNTIFHLPRISHDTATHKNL